MNSEYEWSDSRTRTCSDKVEDKITRILLHNGPFWDTWSNSDLSLELPDTKQSFDTELCTHLLATFDCHIPTPRQDLYADNADRNFRNINFEKSENRNMKVQIRVVRSGYRVENTSVVLR